MAKRALPSKQNPQPVTEKKSEKEKIRTECSVSITCKVTSEPECHYTPRGLAVTKVDVWVGGYTKREGEYENFPNYYKIVLFERLAERVFEELEKGDYVCFHGKLMLRPWKGQDGETRYRNDVTAVACTVLQKADGSAIPTIESVIED